MHRVRQRKGFRSVASEQFILLFSVIDYVKPQAHTQAQARHAPVRKNPAHRT